ncbi:ADP-ribosylation factor-like protein 15 [Carassius carassius]|uniref:ADP-ribosylation factor-like protein 15 n=1 Tax=Carassius carassius TaxID=217509 RepID=UPI0028684E3B|nr:ADP-ribosylation factor-like protein 15 [Carassius carassius]
MMSEHIQLSVALFRIGFYTCLQKLCCMTPPPARPEYDVVCIGLSGAGKTSLLSRLCNEISDGTVPTSGFSIKALPFENAILNVKELGGAESIKKYWNRYYQGSQGVVFVLNTAASDEEMEASRSELHLAMQHPQLCTLPFLILANHQDSPTENWESKKWWASEGNKEGWEVSFHWPPEPHCVVCFATNQTSSNRQESAPESSPSSLLVPLSSPLSPESLSPLLVPSSPPLSESPKLALLLQSVPQNS